MQHRHAEAFLLMTYESEDRSEREQVWNSRDGAVPFCIDSAVSGKPLRHVDWSEDRYAPNHVPKLGARIFVDVTEQTARIWATKVVEHVEQHPRVGAMPIAQAFETREAAVDAVFEAMYTPGMPDVLVVNSGYLEQLAYERGVAKYTS